MRSNISEQQKHKKMGKCIMYKNVSILSFQKQQNNVSRLFPLTICEHIGILPCYFLYKVSVKQTKVSLFL